LPLVVGYTVFEPPTNNNISFVNSSVVNLSWTKNINANSTVIVSKNTGMPSSVSDGTIIYNGTGEYFLFNISLGTSCYLRSWSYIENTSIPFAAFSSNYSDFEYGGLVINCYDENTGVNLSFNVTISNSDGSETYVQTGCTNPHIINESLCPQGSDISIDVTSIGYDHRTYVMDIYTGMIYVLDAYLTLNTSQLYYVQVIDENLYPVSSARVEIKGFINATGEYETLTVLYTDGYGYASVILEASKNYKVIVSKDGFDTGYSDWFTDPVYYGMGYPKIVKIYRTTSVPEEPDYFWTSIDVGCVMTGPGYMIPGNITTSYDDSNSSTIDVDVYIYSYYNGSWTLVDSIHQTNNSFVEITGGVNTTRMHKAIIFFNNSADFIDVVPPVIIVMDPLYIYTNGTGTIKFDLDERIVDIVGPFTISDFNVPWGNIIAFFLGLLVLVLLGPFHVGVALIGCGLMNGFVSGLFSLYLTDEFPVLLVTLCPILVVMGIIYILSKGGRDYL